MDSGNTIICLYSGRAKHLAKVFAESYAQIPLPMNEGAHELLVKARMNIERKMKRIADLVALLNSRMFDGFHHVCTLTYLQE